MAEGKFFFIKSKMNGFVLDAQGENPNPGTKVVTWPQKESSNDNQLWYIHHLTGTIRCKLNNLCLEIDGNELKLEEYDEDKKDQKWATSGDKVYNREDSNRVFDVAAYNKGQGARVCAWNHHGQHNQQWSFEHVPAQYFYLRSLMHDKVLDVKGKDLEPGAKVVVNDKEEGEDSQLWYENKEGIFCSKVHGYVLEGSEEEKLKLQPFESDNERQRWTFDWERVVNIDKKEQVLDIKDSKTKDGAKVISFEWKDEDNQKWAQDYVH